MKKFNISILGIIGILVLVVFASGCTSSDNNTTMSNSSSSNGQSSQSNQPTSSSSNGEVKVIATGPWMGQIMDSSGSRSVSGTGSQTFQLAQNPGMVTVSFSKDNTKDQSNNGTVIPDTTALTVQITDSNGNVLATQTTTADAGNVATSHQF